MTKIGGIASLALCGLVAGGWVFAFWGHRPDVPALAPKKAQAMHEEEKRVETEQVAAGSTAALSVSANSLLDAIPERAKPLAQPMRNEAVTFVHAEAMGYATVVNRAISENDPHLAMLGAGVVSLCQGTFQAHLERAYAEVQGGTKVPGLKDFWQQEVLQAQRNVTLCAGLGPDLQPLRLRLLEIAVRGQVPQSALEYFLALKLGEQDVPPWVLEGMQRDALAGDHRSAFQLLSHGVVDAVSKAAVCAVALAGAEPAASDAHDARSLIASKISRACTK